MIGKVLGNRYRIVELIGEGGMALVYKAECSLLCRTVAIKVLRPQFASDADFVERFRREARAAASLSHPNVVNIYDVGQENGIDYIVMEYIPGNNLKELIRKEAPFSVGRALDITRQIAEALNHAHQRNIIHRDIKPHNILVTDDGQIKVTDFGIARAISEASFTQSGTVVGSVQYSSPEQTQGGEVGPQSDLYSLGCVLYELLTGSIPFKGETSIAIALQHLEGKIVPLRQIRPDIPPAVEKLVDKAMAISLTERYPSALAMLKDISLLKNSGGRETNVSDPTDLPTQIRRLEGKTVQPKKDNKQWVWWVTGLGLIFTMLTVILLILMGVFSPSGPAVPVPNLVGKDLTEARDILKQNSLKIIIISRLYSSKYPTDTIMSQIPPPGQERKAGSEIEVVVSKGPELVRVPDLSGKTQSEAQLSLSEAGLQLGEVLTGADPAYPDGKIIKQLPERGTQIERGASVSITINSSSNLVQVPNFIGRPLAEVRTELVGLGLAFNQASSAPNSMYPEGIITDQQPAPFSKVPMGTAMTFIVSSGPGPH